MNSSLPSPTLAPPAQLVSSVPQTVTLSQQIDGQVSVLENLPVVSSSHAPSLASDIDQTRQDAALWTSSVRPAVVSVLDGISAFSTTFNDAFSALSAAAAQILGGDQAAIATFQAALAPLQQQTTEQIALVSQVQGQLSSYQETLDGDVAALNGDENQLQVAQQSDQQQISALNSQISELESEISDKKLELALLGLFSPLALALKEAIDALTGQQDSTQQALNQAQSDLQSTQSDLNSINAVTGTVSQYLTITGSLVGTLQSLSNGWAALDSNLQVLLESEDITTFNAFTSAQLAAMQADWDNLAQQAATLG